MQTITLERSAKLRVGTSAAHLLPMLFSLMSVTAGISLRWIKLGTNSLWFDEGYTAWAISQPIHGIIKVIRLDTAPPLYYILLHGWTCLFGRSEAALRSMSALMASLALLVFVAITQKIFKTPWARAAAVSLFSFSFMQIAYAHEARFYAMLTLLGALDLYLVLLMCQRATALRIVATTLAWSASLYTNNMMAVYLACLAGCWLILPGKQSLSRRLAGIATVSILSAIIFSPWVPTLVHQAIRLKAGFWPAVPDRWALLRTIGVMAGVHEQSLPSGDWHKFIRVDLALLGLALLGCLSRAGCGLSFRCFCLVSCRSCSFLFIAICEPPSSWSAHSW